MIFYDFQVFKHDWVAVLVNTKTKSTDIIHNDSLKLLYYYRDHEQTVWVGYNSNSYDKYILQGILAGYDPYEVSDFIINKDKFGWEFSKKLNDFPVNSYDTKVGTLSLKQVSAYMGHAIHELNIPSDSARRLTKTELDQVIQFASNEIQETLHVFAQTVDVFNTHMTLLNRFQLPLRHISKSMAQLAAVILKAYPSKNDDSYDVWAPLNCEIEHDEILKFFDRKRVLDGDLTVNFYGVETTFGKGGVHGALPNYHYECNIDEEFILLDIDQQYPTLMTKYDLLSRGAKLPARYEWSVKESLRLKKIGNKKARKPFKDFCNITYGASGDYYNRLFDPRNRLLTSVFGQCFMVDLIEKIAHLVQVIQINTDGVLIKINKNEFDNLDDIVFEWEERTGLTMSFEFFDRVHQKDVNNFIMIGDEVKTAGAYVKQLSEIDNDLPIVNQAVRDYFEKGIPVERTVLAADKLIDFQRVARVTHKFDGATYGGERRHERTFRVFADKNGRSLVRVKNGKASKFGNIPDAVRIVNEDIKNIPAPDWLNRKWYIELAQKRVDDFIGNKEDELKIEQERLW